MKEYDVIVVGSGSGASITETAVRHDKKVALIDKGPIGGTCLNLGCIPSKMLIYPADILAKIKESDKLGIHANINEVEFKEIMERMNKSINESQRKQVRGIKKSEDVDLYNTEAKFIDDYTLVADDTELLGEKIFLCSGARPLIPPIKGLKDIEYLSNESVLDLREKPDSIVIIGGGYISAEYSHFLNQIGVDVSIIQRNNYLVPNEAPKVSEILEKVYTKEMDVFTNTKAVSVSKEDEKIRVIGEKTDSKEEIEIKAEKVMVAAGRKSNADLIEVDKTGVETDKDNYIKVNRELETSKNNIWAIGDAIGKEMFKHVANREARVAANNAFHKDNIEMEYQATPHAVFSHPQIASVGLREKEAKNKYNNLLIGETSYSNVAKGEAMLDKNGYAKGIVDPETGKILGFHIIGPFAPILIQEVVNAMANELPVDSLYKGMHIHPAMPEVILSAFGNLIEI